MRELAAEGNVTVYVGLPTVHFFERIFKSPHTIRPDRFQQLKPCVNPSNLEHSNCPVKGQFYRVA